MGKPDNKAKVYLKDLGIALSLANLCFFRQWYELSIFLPAKGVTKDFNRIYPTSYLALFLDLLILSLFFCALLLFARRAKRRTISLAVQFALFSLLYIPLNFVRYLADDHRLYLSYLGSVFGTAPVICGVVLLMLLILFCIYRYSNQLVVGFRSFLLICLPFTALTFYKAGHAYWDALRTPIRSSVVAPAQSVSSQTPKPERLLWLIFDELDQRITFVNRPAGVSLPEFDRFRSHSVTALNAYPPAGCTQVTMPALLTGTFHYPEVEGGLGWANSPSLLHKLYVDGYKTAFFGWYFPYCHLLSDDLDDCYHMPGANREIRPYSEYLSEGMINGFFNFFVGELRFKDEWFYQYLHIQNYKNMYKKSMKSITDPKINLVIAHWPIPHLPWIFDRKTMNFSLNNNSPTGYLDNLVLADRTLGEIRKKMEEKDLWDHTTVLLSTDHWCHQTLPIDGKSDHRIPWMLKFPNQTEPITYADTFNTLSSYSLVPLLMRNTIKSPKEVVEWLTKNASHNPPYLCHDDPEPNKGLVSPM